MNGDGLKVLHVSASDGGGGAGRAAFRTHCALRGRSGDVCSRMLVGRKVSSDAFVSQLERNAVHRGLASAVRRFTDLEDIGSRTDNPVFRSSARVRTSGPQRIAELAPDILVLHWLGSRMLSVNQIGSQPYPTAWVLHDSWAFCGAEHHPFGDTDQRFELAYSRESRLPGEWGLDLNRRVWERKRRHWLRPMQLIAPSTWMAGLASRSSLVGEWPCEVIPNPVDVSWWGGLTRLGARSLLGIPAGQTLLLFGALGGDKNAMKGADLLYAALERVPLQSGFRDRGNLEIVTFGGRTGERRIGPHRVRSVGHLNDAALRQYYSAADVMVVPSRMDNLPQTAVEPIACGTPVVAFRTGGLPDIVDDGRNGRLAEPFSPDSLAEAILWVLESEERHQQLCAAATASAARWSPDLIARRYVGLFEEMLAR